jgi:hypothetical protein
MNENIQLTAARDANRRLHAVSRTPDRGAAVLSNSYVMNIAVLTEEESTLATLHNEQTSPPPTKRRPGRRAVTAAENPTPQNDNAVGSESAREATPILVKLSEITVDPSIQSRAGLNEKVVDKYAERMKAGDVFPAVNVFRTEAGLLLADGFHTYEAARRTGFTEISALTNQGSRKDAIEFSLRANTTHGLPRTNEDKRQAARLALEEFSDRSDGAIAEMIKVSQSFVSGIRRELKSDLSSVPRLGRDGKKRKSPNPKSPRPKKSAKAEVDQTPMRVELAEPSADESKEEPCDAETPTAFDQDQAWEGVEDCLRTRLEGWPQGMRKAFGDRLRKFADNECR